MNSDFKELLSALNGFQVKYLVIGGYAVMKYAEPRFTKDLDIWVKADNENARAVFDALKCVWLTPRRNECRRLRS
jgi:hypothetical protein